MEDTVNIRKVHSRSDELSNTGSVASDYGLDHRAIEVRSSSLCIQTESWTHPASCTMGTGSFLPGDKARSGCDYNHSPPPSSAEVENE
jgi:hypothetical protein